MSIRNDLSVDWEASPRIITIAAPSTSILIQDLHDTCRDIEDNLPESLEYAKLIDSAGKEPLGGGSYVGITATLQNAKLAFEARPGPSFVSCTVTGGNLVAVDANGVNMDPIQVTDYTQVTIAQSSSPTIATPPSDYGMLYLLESLRGRHASVGDMWYWDPTRGDDANDGTTPSTAVLSFSQAQTLAASGSYGGVGGIIFALSTASGGVTTVTESMTVTTPGLKLRGPGYSFQIKPAAGSDPVTISADDVEFSGFYVEPTAGGTDNGITITGNNALVKDCWVKSATANGIDISSTTRTEINTCAVEDSAGNGINIGASTSLSSIKKCIITGSGGDGVYLSGASVTDNILENNLIYNNTGYGVDIAASSVTRTGIRLHHTFAGNASDIVDSGTDTFQDTSGAVTSGDISNIVSGVWSEVITTGYTTAGSAAKVLKDAKTRATLASLK